jgi:hypothetical protein
MSEAEVLSLIERVLDRLYQNGHRDEAERWLEALSDEMESRGL